MKEGKIQKIYIVIVTTLSNENEKQTYFDIGADEFLPKPIQTKDIKLLLEKFLKYNDSKN